MDSLSDNEIKRLIELAKIAKETLPREMATTSALEDFLLREIEKGDLPIKAVEINTYVEETFPGQFSVGELRKALKDHYETYYAKGVKHLRVTADTREKVRSYLKNLKVRFYGKG